MFKKSSNKMSNEKKLVNLLLKRHVDAIQALLMEALEVASNNGEYTGEVVDMFENMRKLSESIQSWKDKGSTIFVD